MSPECRGNHERRRRTDAAAVSAMASPLAGHGGAFGFEGSDRSYASAARYLAELIRERRKQFP